MEPLACVFQVALFVFAAFQGSEVSKRIIFISPNGTDLAPNCGDNINNPCLTLDFAILVAVNQTGANSTQISAAKGNYTLINSYSFRNVNNFALVGRGSRPDDVEITCKTNASLSFILGANIFLKGIKLRKCGGWRQSSVNAKKPYSGLDGVNFKVALDF